MGNIRSILKRSPTQNNIENKDEQKADKRKAEKDGEREGEEIVEEETKKIKLDGEKVCDISEIKSDDNGAVPEVSEKATGTNKDDESSDSDEESDSGDDSVQKANETQVTLIGESFS